ncbi:LytTR family DNA-binding domain-containing protein [Dyadobacter sp. CY356]|uniref:LytR/AlgR family response regulator transcription factor n=1 Tax=Dyadobacter sp. CY356 TaxID=2906442 RepID=UPI001F25B34A|nr:response regulator transcription factor [Dyadobacter sp. CY356]MCF0055249.1 response regulator [Dyadobacter sp. CY356]
MKKIKVVIIDDEQGARMELRRMLKVYAQVTVLGEAADADQAELMIRSLRPDLIFLDIQMPGRSGFDLLETLDHLPHVIFVTAFDQYAIRAFEVSAMDYLMKPVREERFAKALSQAIDRICGRDEPSVFVKDRGRYHLIKWKDIQLIESVENYARLWFGNNQVLVKTSLNKLEQNPDCKMFFRASRGQMFNMDFIKSILKEDNTMSVELTTGEMVHISERQATKFRNLKRQ